MEIVKFTFGPFSENSYVLVDSESKECIVVDPGMYDSAERLAFSEYITERKLIPKLLLNTHCHIDHVMGNKFINDTYGLFPQIHEKAEQMLERAGMAASMYGLNYDPSPKGEKTLVHEEILNFREHQLKILFTPGHAPGHVVLFNAKDNYLIGGDVLFKGSVGRVDLPGSNSYDLIKSIQEVVYRLPDETLVYAGHGPETTIGEEKVSNAYVRESDSSLS